MDNIPTSQTILYELYKDDDRDKFIGEYSSLHKEEAIFNLRINHDYDGILICKASVQNNSEVVPIFSKPMVFQVVGEFIKWKWNIVKMPAVERKNIK